MDNQKFIELINEVFSEYSEKKLLNEYNQKIKQNDIEIINLFCIKLIKNIQEIKNKILSKFQTNKNFRNKLHYLSNTFNKSPFRQNQLSPDKQQIITEINTTNNNIETQCQGEVKNPNTNTKLKYIKNKTKSFSNNINHHKKIINSKNKNKFLMKKIFTRNFSNVKNNKSLSLKNNILDNTSKQINKEINQNNYRNFSESIQKNKSFISTISNDKSKSNIQNSNYCKILANDVISFIDNMQKLQVCIIKKEPNVKKQKIVFEKQKYNLYKKASQLSDLYCPTNYEYHNNENNQLNSTIEKLRKTIDDLNNNTKYLNDQFKVEINRLNEKLNEEKNNSKKISDNFLTEIRSIYNKLNIFYTQNNNIIVNDLTNNASENKFNFYYEQIINILNDLFRNNYFSQNEIKNILVKEIKNIIDIINNKNIINEFENFITKDNYDINLLFEYLKNILKLFSEDITKEKNKQNTDEKLNTTLISIQNELIQKFENKNEEIKKMQTTLNEALKFNLKKDNNFNEIDFESFNEKYEYLLDLYHAEQQKVIILQEEYIKLVQKLTSYIFNGEEILIEIGKMWNMTPKIKTDFNLEEFASTEMGKLNDSDLLSSKDEDGENEKTNKDVENLYNNINDLKGVINTVSVTLIKICKEIEISEKHKGLFVLMFKLLGISENEIQNLILNKK